MILWSSSASWVVFTRIKIGKAVSGLFSSMGGLGTQTIRMLFFPVLVQGSDGWSKIFSKTFPGQEKQKLEDFKLWPFAITLFHWLMKPDFPVASITEDKSDSPSIVLFNAFVLMTLTVGNGFSVCIPKTTPRCILPIPNSGKIFQLKQNFRFVNSHGFYSVIPLNNSYFLLGNTFHCQFSVSKSVC